MSKPLNLIFIHGLANKPPLQDLRRLWLEALRKPVSEDMGFDPEAEGITVSFVYWADLFYDHPISAEEYESRTDELASEVEEDLTLPENAWVNAMRKHFPDQVSAYPDAPIGSAANDYERVPLPDFIKQDIMKHFLREAHDYLFNVNDVKSVIRKRVLSAASDGTKKHILVGHSLGSVIAYDVLTGYADFPHVSGLLTLGSPLGIDEVQDKLVWTRNNGFPEKLESNWVNVFDSFDVVARTDPYLATDFLKSGVQAVIDVKEQNWGTWRHSATKYLQGPLLRKHLRSLCGT